MVQSVRCRLSLRKIDFHSRLGDMTFVVERRDIETNFSRAYASSVFRFIDLTHLNTQTTGRTPLNE
jgi:hypothetical protein